MEPQNALHARNYQQVVAKIGATGGSGQITSEEGALMVDELEAIAPFIDQHYAEEVIATARAALTDAELFVSYNMPEKALGPLAAALPAAPRHIKLNQRLASLYTRTGLFADAALCCRTLQGVYGEAGFGEESARYGDLAAKYEDRGALAAKAAAVDGPVEHASAPLAFAASATASSFAEFAVVAPEIESQPDEREEEATGHTAPLLAASAAVPAGNGDEIDLSEEWEDSATEVSADVDADASHEPVVQTTAEDSVAATVAEIHFYLQYGMVQQAHAGLAKLEGLTDDRAMLDALRIEVAQKAPQAVAAQPEVSEAGEVTSDALKVDAPDEEIVQLDASTSADEVETAPAPTPESAASGRTISKLDDFVADLEAELPEDFMAPATPAIPPADVIVPVATPAPRSASLSATQTQQVSAAAAKPAFEKPATVSAPVAVQAPFSPPATAISVPAGVAEAGADLNDMFDELRAGLEDETAPTHEDPEDHYNLGVAFREMGLIDEAIGELQKVCQSIDRGAPFKYTMQAYTWLAQCFLDKGVPEASIRWYEKALKLPNLDEEGRTALHYELASAYEAAQNKRAALAHFMEVYGANIDYRDVGERIHALKS